MVGVVEAELTGVEVELTHLFSLPKLDDKHTCLGADLAFIDNNTHTQHMGTRNLHQPKESSAHLSTHASADTS